MDAPQTKKEDLVKFCLLIKSWGDAGIYRSTGPKKGP
jgi:hypothetical protein